MVNSVNQSKSRNRIQVSVWQSCLGGWSLCLLSTHFPSCGDFCTGAPTQGMEPLAKRGCIVPEHITASFPVDILQLVCSKVGLAPAGSKHEMAQRLVGFCQRAGSGAAGSPDHPMQWAMIAPGRPRVDTQLRWPPCWLSRSPWLTQ